MTPLSWRCAGLAIVGDDLHTAIVRGGPLGGRAEPGPTLARFLAIPADEAKSALRALRGVRRVVIVVPGAWCATRPIQITSAHWLKARPEIERSVDRLLPMPADDVELGLVDVFAAEDDIASGGALVAVRRSRLEPWMKAIEAAIGRRPTVVLAPAMAALGLGAVDADVVEPGQPSSAHRIRSGRLRAVGDALDSASESPQIVLPDGGTAPGVSGAELASAAALAPVAGAGMFHPLGGAGLRPTSPWLAPAVGAAAAVALLAASSAVYSGRLAGAERELTARHAELGSRVASAQALRADAERLIRLVDNGVNGATRGWRSVMPVAAAAHRAMGDEGFLYRLDVTGESVTMSGESPSASAVLERVEAGGELRSARHAAPVSKSSATRMDVFEIRAERAAAPRGSP